MTQIKNIIFDLGGVLLNIDYNKTSVAFRELGFDRFDEMFSQFTADHLFEQLETGQVSNEDFLEKIMLMVPSNINRQQIISAWNAMLLDFRKESLNHLVSLHGKYNIYLLSNTNAIHLQSFSETLGLETGKPSLDLYFRKAWYSHVIGKRKPHKETYEFVLADENLLAHETLFIDDSINNIVGAIEAGLQTHHLKEGERIEDLEL